MTGGGQFIHCIHCSRTDLSSARQSNLTSKRYAPTLTQCVTRRKPARLHDAGPTFLLSLHSWIPTNLFGMKQVCPLTYTRDKHIQVIQQRNYSSGLTITSIWINISGANQVCPLHLYKIVFSVHFPFAHHHPEQLFWRETDKLSLTCETDDPAEKSLCSLVGESPRHDQRFWREIGRLSLICHTKDFPIPRRASPPRPSFLARNG